jgi:hypothetical protein
VSIAGLYRRLARTLAFVVRISPERLARRGFLVLKRRVLQHFPPAALPAPVGAEPDLSSQTAPAAARHY